MSRSHVTNLLRLLNLDGRIQHWMKQGHLSEGHGKLLAGLPTKNNIGMPIKQLKKNGQWAHWMMPLKRWRRKKMKPDKQEIIAAHHPSKSN